MSESPIECFECEKGRLRLRKMLVQKELKGEDLQFFATVLSCDSCNKWEIPISEADSFGLALDAAYRERVGLLFPKQIREYRERLGMNQEEFAAYLGVGPASIKRWELGAIQDKSSDELIRLKCDAAYASRHLRELAERLGDIPAAEPQRTTAFLVVKPLPRYLQDWTRRTSRHR